MKKYSRIKRLLQLVTGVHRIHHARFSFGWKLPFLRVAYFPAWTTRGERPVRYAHGWQRIGDRSTPAEVGQWHDCTATGR